MRKRKEKGARVIGATQEAQHAPAPGSPARWRGGPPVGVRDVRAHNRLAWQVHRVLRLVGQVRAAILHFGDPRVRVMRVFPLLVRDLLALARPGQPAAARASTGHGCLLVPVTNGWVINLRSSAPDGRDIELPAALPLTLRSLLKVLVPEVTYKVWPSNATLSAGRSFGSGRITCT